MCEHIDLPGGDHAIICGLRAFKKFCACGRRADLLCDWKVSARKSGTCDKPICAAHALEVAPGKHLCPEHQGKWDEWKRLHPPAQKPLFGEAA
jgi:hypothetical protein